MNDVSAPAGPGVRLRGVPMAVTVKPAVTIIRCQGCGACLLTCPEHGLRPVPGGPLVLPGRCTGCGECIEICPAWAIAEGAAG
jgi:Pyruvate/2-oxoacid:ferredoxin oxidoreductase delta subunit